MLHSSLMEKKKVIYRIYSIVLQAPWLTPNFAENKMAVRKCVSRSRNWRIKKYFKQGYLTNIILLSRLTKSEILYLSP